VIKKPFEPIEVLQCANALTRKWDNERTLRRQLEQLEHVVETRTQGLEAAQAVAAPREPRCPEGLPNRILLDDRLAQAVAHADARHIFAVACSIWNASRWLTIRSGTAPGMSSSRKWRTASPV